jgi:hypothetical protein
MVEEGYYIPIQEAKSTKSIKDRRRLNKTVKMQDTVKVANKHLAKSAMQRGQLQQQQEDQNSVASGNSYSALPAVTEDQPFTTQNSNNAINNTYNQTEDENGPDFDYPEDATLGQVKSSEYIIKSFSTDSRSDHVYTVDSMASVTPRGRFTMRKIREDNQLQENLQIHAVMRIKESLEQKIVALEDKLQLQQQERQEDLNRAMAMKEESLLEQNALNNEIYHLTQKVIPI